MKKLIALVLALLMVIAMTACGSTPAASDAPKTDAPATDAPKTDAPVTDAPATGSGDPVKVVFIPKNLGNPYFEAINMGFEKAIEEIGADKFEYEFTGRLLLKPQARLSMWTPPFKMARTLSSLRRTPTTR